MRSHWSGAARPPVRPTSFLTKVENRTRTCTGDGDDDDVGGGLGRILPHGSREEPTLATLILDFQPPDPGGDSFLLVKSLVWQPDHQQTVTRKP